jgi:hypothetical protein
VFINARRFAFTRICASNVRPTEFSQRVIGIQGVQGVRTCTAEIGSRGEQRAVRSWDHGRRSGVGASRTQRRTGSSGSHDRVWRDSRVI